MSTETRRVSLDQAFDIEHSSGLQDLMRASYEQRMLEDLIDFAAASEQIADLDSSASTRLESLRGRRLPASFSYVHAEYTLLVGDGVEVEKIRAVYAELLEALLDPTPSGLSIGSFAPDTLTHRRFREFAIDQEALSSEFDAPELRKPAVIEPVPADEFDHYRSVIAEVLDSLKQYAPANYSDIADFVSDIGVFRGKPVRGASAPAFFGCVLVREPDDDVEAAVWFADHLVHEAAHHRLYTVIVDDPLVANDVTVTSPVRKDPRPLSGVVHALFVETKLVDAFTNLAKALAVSTAAFPGSLAAIDDKIAEFRELHRQCVEVISQHRGELTDGGRQLLDYCASAI